MRACIAHLRTSQDRVSVLQAIPNEVRQYVVLHGKSRRWNELVDSCKFYEQQLRMVDAASIRLVAAACSACFVSHVCRKFHS